MLDIRVIGVEIPKINYVDREQWIDMDLVTKPNCMTKIILGIDGKKTEKYYLTLDPHIQCC